MNILAICKLYCEKNKSGGEMYLHHLLKKIQKYHNVSVLIPKVEIFEQYNYDGISVTETEESNWKEYIKQADLVITQLDYAEEVMKECLIINKKCVYITHGEITPLLIKYVNNPNIIKIFNSNYLKNNFNREFNGIKGKNFIIYPYTKDLSEYATKDLKYRQYITLVNPQFFKGSDLFYELVEKMPDKKFMVVEGGYYPHLQRIEYKYPNLTIQKNTDDMINDVFLKSRIILQPSRVESYGMVASESCSIGIPVIVNKLSKGLKENIGKIGLFGTVHQTLTKKDIKSFINLINLLDDESTYILWSNYFLEHAENRRNEVESQINNFIDFLNTF